MGSERQPPMSLNAELDAFRADFIAKVPAEIQEAMERADMELAAPAILEHGLKAGDKVPGFRLPDACGGFVQRNDLPAEGAVVLSFHRRGWSHYCNLELRALQKTLPEITRLGAQLVAIFSSSG